MRRSLLRTLIGAGAALSVLTASSATAGATVVLALSFDPNPAKPGHPVMGSVTAPREAAGGETDCSLEFDGRVVPTQCRDLGNGGFQAVFTVPDQAKPGSHVVAGYVVGLPVTGSLDVVEMTKVPTLEGLTYAQAQDAAKLASLALCAHPSHEGVVSAQDPLPGSLVPVGSCVDVRLVSEPATQLVAVPNLVRSSLAQARSTLANVGLVLREPGGSARDDQRIASQTPTAGTFVRPRAAVSVTVDAGSGAVTRTSNPRGGGSTGPPASGSVTTTPPARGSPAPDTSAGHTPVATVSLPVVGAILLVLLAIVWLLSSLALHLRRGRDRRWAHQHVTVRTAELSSLRGGPHVPPGRSGTQILVRPHRDAGKHHLEEVAR